MIALSYQNHDVISPFWELLESIPLAIYLTVVEANCYRHILAHLGKEKIKKLSVLVNMYFCPHLHLSSALTTVVL